MSRDLNKWHGIGRIGKDIELKYLANGNAVTTISLACGDDYKDKQGNKVERTEWIRVTFFGKIAEILGKYCAKGSKIYVEGKFTTKKWQDKNGNNQYTTEIVASEMQMLGNRETGNAPQSPQYSNTNAPAPAHRGAAPSRPNAPVVAPYTNDEDPEMGCFDDDIPF